MGFEWDNNDHTCLFTPTTMTVLLKKCGYRSISYYFVAENFCSFKPTIPQKLMAHAMWILQVAVGLIRPSLCKSFITVAEPIT